MQKEPHPHETILGRTSRQPQVQAQSDPARLYNRLKQNASARIMHDDDGNNTSKKERTHLDLIQKLSLNRLALHLLRGGIKPLGLMRPLHLTSG